VKEVHDMPPLRGKADRPPLTFRKAQGEDKGMMEYWNDGVVEY